MGVQDLLFKARLDGIDRVIPQESMRWFLQVRCARCGELNDKDIYFTFTETVEKSGTPGIFNFVMRCKFCTNQSTIKMLSLVPYSQTENCQRVAQCEVRGLQIVSWKLTNGFLIRSETGKEWNECDLSQSDWCEYDEEAGAVVGVYEIETQVS